MSFTGALAMPVSGPAGFIRDIGVRPGSLRRRDA
jgi:hypothetical protein